MHDACEEASRHDHVFGQDQARPGEQQTRVVIALTAVTMVVEIGAGLAFGSMALLADGLHMASHTAALGVSAFAYAWVRRHAGDPVYSFGAGKMNALAGFSGAILLAGFAALMAWESVARLFRPVPVAFAQAIAVAVLGLAVNAVSALVLTRAEAGDHAHDHAHGHEPGHHHDHNLRSAYLHVLADALTSVLAIVALAGGAFLGWSFLDPAMGVVGAAIVTRWSAGLLVESGRVLLDRQAPSTVLERIRLAVESRPGDRVADLHVWQVAPGGWAAIVTVVSAEPLTPDGYRRLLPDRPLPHARDGRGRPVPAPQLNEGHRNLFGAKPGQSSSSARRRGEEKGRPWVGALHIPSARASRQERVGGLLLFCDLDLEACHRGEGGKVGHRWQKVVLDGGPGPLVNPGELFAADVVPEEKGASRNKPARRLAEDPCTVREMGEGVEAEDDVGRFGRKPRREDIAAEPGDARVAGAPRGLLDHRRRKVDGDHRPVAEPREEDHLEASCPASEIDEVQAGEAAEEGQTPPGAGRDGLVGLERVPPGREGIEGLPLRAGGLRGARHQI